jgi:Golgi apparatus protein 1|uniref:Golgi apparatus protein 1 n=1 Tax=Tetraselmis chuii TaxID=63592 RepID=A0A7S1X9L8_9CHLO|mmetsp:Transcript_6759/g.12237  ORF Transcript_6759/g.12237 Transcript_6759/m.12237 type:complete len:901 (+) Transcript_6759:588-3290(+)|eukprot:CAMPEP_0177752896 /NCGR_PEP_ID=MMETSP0491_2-20121128/1161_1 /TAXON_ID=63592 /ORGANISM="Tetraselmis chuii, Strain PLY429" /LENGTH=900 /DNA_ID=CAMNT_0019268125 /DNA_START=4728 /DNA_END=7430 /DNA_ORIENTATION=+
MRAAWVASALLALLALSALGSGPAGVKAAEGADLAEQIAEAAEAQEYREEAPAEVVAEIVAEAPPAVLNAGDGDVSTTGSCATDIDAFCVDITPGGGRIADCLTGQLREEDNGGGEGAALSDDCKDELAEFKADRSTNINKDLPLATSCREDVAKFCTKEFLMPEPGAVLTCLREVKDELSQACSSEVFRTMEDGAEDFRNDAMLYELCVGDAETLCADVEPGGGRVQECLRKKRAQLSWDCQEELFRQEVENADDLRLSVKLFRSCLGDKKKFCSKVKPGAAHAKDCLEDNRNDPAFSEDCKTEIESMMERRAVDFRLDPELRDLCRNDIEEVCGYEKESLDSIAGFDARVTTCLMDYRDEILVPECKGRVEHLIALASEDIRFNVPLADACFEDRQNLCANVQPGSARVLRCLQDQRESLSYECRATLFDQEVRMSENIDFQYPLKKNCKSELKRYCDGIPHGHARAIKCLEDNVDKPDMSEACQTEVRRFENRENQDYRLNYRLNTACEVEIDMLCPDVCNPMLGEACGGTVLRCLSEHQDDIKEEECKKEVTYFINMEVTDFRNDVILAEACRGDILQYCPDVEPGDGRIIRCLQDNRESISTACKNEENKLEQLQSNNINNNPVLKRVCKEERQTYCKNVQVGRARVIRCLQENMNKSDFSEACKGEISRRLYRKTVDYRLDPGINRKCKSEINSGVCQDAKSQADGENAAVLKCLVNNFETISETCQGEVARATRTALWAFKEEHPFTQECDADVDRLCLNGKPISFYSYGTVGRCLASKKAEGATLSTGCNALVEVGAPRNQKRDFDTSLTMAGLANKMEGLVGLGKGTLVSRPIRGKGRVLTLSGWLAFAGMFSLVVVVLGGAYLSYRKYRYGDTGLNFGYTMVMKTQPGRV